MGRQYSRLGRTELKVSRACPGTRHGEQNSEHEAHAQLDAALAYVNTRSFLTSTIVGSITLDQLHDNIASIDVMLFDELLAEIEAIHGAHPIPCP